VLLYPIYLCSTNTPIIKPCRIGCVRLTCRTHFMCIFLRICHVSACCVYVSMAVLAQYIASFPPTEKKWNIAGFCNFSVLCNPMYPWNNVYVTIYFLIKFWDVYCNLTAELTHHVLITV